MTALTFQMVLNIPIMLTLRFNSLQIKFRIWETMKKYMQYRAFFASIVALQLFFEKVVLLTHFVRFTNSLCPVRTHSNKKSSVGKHCFVAEKVGFEPTVPCGTHAFQACQLNHSCTSPRIQKYDFFCI